MSSIDRRNYYEISKFLLKGVECNILLVSIESISVEGVSESNVHETHYGEERLRRSAS